MTGSLSPSSVIDKLTNGLNLIVALDPNSIGPNYSKLGQHLNIIQPSSAELVTDHFNSLGSYSVSIIPTINPAIRSILNTSRLNQTKPITFTGIGHSLNRSPLVIPVCYSSPSAYSPPFEHQTGSAINLVSAVQLKNNQRIIWSGSLDWFK